ncbi:MAG: F-box protein 18 (helicase) [Vicingaceae bacterium]
MQLTQEQTNIVNSTGDIKINAVAGSGKTTTVIEYAKNQPKSCRILYIAFNKSVRLEADKKFREKGLTNVTVETAHSLAYKNTVFQHKYVVRHQGYKTYELVEMLQLTGSGEKLAEYVIANHINKFMAYFCNSDKAKVQELNYLDIVTDEKAQVFVTTFYDYIEAKTRLLLSKMNSSKIEITHDFYLKKFQLSKPILNYDYILFDEGQDASSTMLDIFLKQKATKVIVGDTHQQIYGWRYAVNSLEKVDFKTFNLSTSFRFSQDIANLSMEVLNWKTGLTDYEQFPIKGEGSTTKHTTKAVLARTNLGLLLQAIEYVTEKKMPQKIYFEGNINSYTYADEGASLYDVLNLDNGKYTYIKDKLIKKMSNLDELEEYVKKTEDIQLGLMIEIVRKYGNEIPSLIKKIKDQHVAHDEKEKAEMIFSTVHRSKGMEYDTVKIVNDFISEEKIEKSKKDQSKVNVDPSKIIEEINLLYVAVTRTKNIVHIPESLLPKDFPPSPYIHIELIDSKPDKKSQSTSKAKKQNDTIVKSYTAQESRLKPSKAHQSWTADLDKELLNMHNADATMTELICHFKRSSGSLRMRIDKLTWGDDL